MSAVVSGLIGGLVAAGLGVLAVRTQKAATANVKGWKRLRPGWYVHLAAFGCLAIAAFIAYFFWIGGSAREDAGRQNAIAFLLLVAFAAGAAWTFFTNYFRKVEWKGNDIRVIGPFARVSSYRFSDVVDAAESKDGLQIKLILADGRVLRVSIYAHGYDEFMGELADRCPIADKE